MNDLDDAYDALGRNGWAAKDGAWYHPDHGTASFSLHAALEMLSSQGRAARETPCAHCNAMRVRVMQVEKVAQAAAIELQRLRDTISERELEDSDEQSIQRIVQWINENTNPSSVA